MATTTLTNGTKIPERASRDWYSDLSTNWYLLDNHLGDTGSHLDDGLAPKATADASGNTITSTYATKTELSTLSTTVGTKANDADVVHKADAETITGAKTFSATVTSANVVPSATDTYSLGSASVQYNRIYGKSYFYDGVAWGLDQDNEWTANQTIYRSAPVINLKTSAFTLGQDAPSSDVGLGGIYYKDSSGTNFAYSAIYDTSNFTLHRMVVRNKYTDGVRSATGSTITLIFDLALSSSGQKIIKTDAEIVRPWNNGSSELGSSTHKWKTLNGVNPGALSLPYLPSKSDIKEYITDTAGGANWYTVSYDGYVSISALGKIELALTNTTHRTVFYATICDVADVGGYYRAFIPVVAPYHVKIVAYGTVGTAEFIPCIGNV